MSESPVKIETDRVCNSLGERHYVDYDFIKSKGTFNFLSVKCGKNNMWLTMAKRQNSRLSSEDIDKLADVIGCSREDIICE